VNQFLKKEVRIAAKPKKCQIFDYVFMFPNQRSLCCCWVPFRERRMPRALALEIARATKTASASARQRPLLVLKMTIFVTTPSAEN
jgi:hypothetical protein